MASPDLASLQYEILGTNKKNLGGKKKKKGTIEGHHMMTAVLYIPAVHLHGLLCPYQCYVRNTLSLTAGL